MKCGGVFSVHCYNIFIYLFCVLLLLVLCVFVLRFRLLTLCIFPMVLFHTRWPRIIRLKPNEGCEFFTFSLKHFSLHFVIVAIVHNGSTSRWAGFPFVFFFLSISLFRRCSVVFFTQNKDTRRRQWQNGKWKTVKSDCYATGENWNANPKIK